MTDVPGRGFVDRFVEDIDDDLPRLVWADWLDENGRADRAEFVRVQVERARLPAWDAGQVRLRLREADLLRLHGEAWLAEMPAVEGARWEGFRRGVVAEVSFASFEAMRQSAHACRAVAPVEAVTVRWPRRREGRKAAPPIAELRELNVTGTPDETVMAARLADSPQLASLRRLTARGLWADALAELVASPHLAGLRELRLPNNNLGNPGLRALTESDTLAALEELDVSAMSRHERYNHDPVIHASGMGALMRWAGLANVRSLNLAGNDVSRDGLRALLRSPHAAGLKHLSLRDGRLDGQAMAELEGAVAGLSLDSLDLGENLLRDVGAEYVALAPCLRELKSLRLDRCEVTRDGARLFAKKAVFLAGLRTLDVGHNHFGAGGLGALLDRNPPALHTLGLRDNDLYDKGAERLAESPASDALVEADLSDNDLGPAAARALGATDHLRGLLVLRVSDNPIGRAGGGLTASPLGRRLAVLEWGTSPAPVAEPPLPPADGDDIPF